MCDETTTQPAPERPIDTLRRAAAQLRVEQSSVFRPLAAWLHTAGADLWAFGPLHCEDGCGECDDHLWMPHVRHALRFARTYLGSPS